MSISIDKVQGAIDSLNRKLTIANSALTPKDFFNQVASVYEFIIRQPIFVEAISQMQQDYEEIYSPLDKVQEKLVDEISETFIKLKKIVLDSNLIPERQIEQMEAYYSQSKLNKMPKFLIPHHMRHGTTIISAFSEWYMVLHEHTTSLSGQNKIEMLYDRAEGIVESIFNSGNKELIKDMYEPFITSEGKAHIRSYTFSPSWQEYLNTKSSVTRKAETIPWFALNRIKLVPLVMYDYPEYLSKKDNKNIANRMNISLLVEEMKKILNGQNDQVRFFQKDSFQLYLDKVADYLVDHLTFNKKAKQTTNKDSSPEYDQIIIKADRDLPQSDVDIDLTKKIEYFEDKDDDQFILKYGNQLPVSFSVTSDLGLVLHVLHYKKGEWVHVIDIARFALESNVKTVDDKNYSNLSKKINRIINDIRKKKLKPSELEDRIIIDAAHNFIGKKGAGFYRLRAVFP